VLLFFVTQRNSILKFAQRACTTVAAVCALTCQFLISDHIIESEDHSHLHTS
jgi:hypothetical protein